MGEKLLEHLQSLQNKYPLIGDIRGQGLMIAVELVKDRQSKEPATEETAAIFEETRRQGLVLSKSGPYRSVLRIVPPLCLAKSDVEQVVTGLDRAFSVVT